MSDQRIEELQAEINRLKQERLDRLKLKKIDSIDGMNLIDVVNWLDDLRMNHEDSSTIHIGHFGDFMLHYE